MVVFAAAESAAIPSGSVFAGRLVRFVGRSVAILGGLLLGPKIPQTRKGDFPRNFFDGIVRVATHSASICPTNTGGLAGDGPIGVPTDA